MRKYITFLLVFTLSPAFSDTQYRPTASPVHHGLTFGLTFGPFQEGKSPFSTTDPFLTYNYYFTDKWLPEKYQGYLTVGLELKAGLNQIYGDCSGYRAKPLPVQAGVKLRLIYWERFQPFVGMNWVKTFCQKNFKTFKSSSVKPEYIFPLGFSVSLKNLDSAAVYSLDEDYGLNDLSFLMQCFRINTQRKSKGRFVCEAGIEAVF